jgi:Family of unknown function (DUF6338)
MPEISKDIVALLSFLLPGFLMAWIFYSLTTHEKPTQFERVIQALIFTFFVKLLVTILKATLEFVGRFVTIGIWSADIELFFSFLVALLLGIVAAYIVNTDRLHTLFRKFGFSQKSSHQTEWAHVFSAYQRYIVLHLKDDTSIYGWPKVWPSDPDKGHFFIVAASWLGPNGAFEDNGTEGILVEAKDVKFIEFVKNEEKSE